MDFEVNLYNSQSVTHFGCPKTYGFYEDMLVTMDLGDPDIEQDNMDIWVLVDMLPIQPWSLLDYTCGEIWWNLDDIQRPVVLKFAIFGPSDSPHPTTIFQS